MYGLLLPTKAPRGRQHATLPSHPSAVSYPPHVQVIAASCGTVYGTALQILNDTLMSALALPEGDS